MNTATLLQDLNQRHGWSFRRQGITSVYQDGHLHLEFVREASAPSGYAARTWLWTRSRKTAPETLLLDEADPRLAADGLHAQLQALRLLDQLE